MTFVLLGLYLPGLGRADNVQRGGRLPVLFLGCRGLRGGALGRHLPGLHRRREVRRDRAPGDLRCRRGRHDRVGGGRPDVVRRRAPVARL